jgi:hypothetical protein
MRRTFLKFKNGMTFPEKAEKTRSPSTNKAENAELLKELTLEIRRICTREADNINLTVARCLDLV